MAGPEGMRSLGHMAAAYGLTGGLAAAVDLGVFWALAARLPALEAATLSFLMAAAVNYRLSSQWVFQRDWRQPAQALRFLLFALAGLGVNAGVTAWLAVPLGPLAAKACGIAMAFGVNFMMNARWVFRSKTTVGWRPGPGLHPSK